MSRRSAALAFAALVSLLLSGVGFGRVLASPAHTNHAASSLALRLVHAGYLTVGSDTTYPPMESINPSNHEPIGADVGLAKALARALHLKGAKIVSSDFNTIIPALQRGNFDVIMSSMNDTPDRRKQIDFVDYMRASEGIVVSSGSSIRGNTYAAVCGHSISVQSGTTEQDGLKAQKCGQAIDIKVYTKDTDAFQAFASGHADAYTGDLPVCAYYVKHRSGLRLAGKPFGAGEDYGIGVLKNNKALSRALRAAVVTIRKNGQYRRILNRWGVAGAGL